MLGILLLLLACGGEGRDDSGLDGGADGGGADGGGADGGGTDGGGSTSAAPPIIQAVAGELGSLVWLVDPAGHDLAEITIQARREGSWADVCRGVEGCALQPGAEAVRASVGALRSEELALDALVSLSAAPLREEASYYNDEEVLLSGGVSGEAGPAALFLSRPAEGGVEWWSGSGWSAEPAPLTWPQLAALSAAEQPGTAMWTVALGSLAEGFGVEGGGSGAKVLSVARAEYRVIELGRRVLWGDPHVHSDLSQDGCEDPASGCKGHDTEPGADVFYNAIDAGLDWMNLADHAEMTVYQGSPDAAPIDIWTRQQQLAQEALGIGILPFVGYEWTYARSSRDSNGYKEGGHRTVILEEPEACDAWRIAATPEPADHAKGWGGTVVSTANAYYATSPTAMRQAMLDAAAACGEQRALFIAHHPALGRPQPIDWRAEVNIPDLRWEPLIEIASEHGTSECYDLNDSYCDFRPFEVSTYYGWGSFQAALSMGYKVGVMGGSDTHDALPASFDDGPSATSVVLRDGSLAYQNYQGAMTGTMTAPPYDRYALFDGLFARSTIASTGPFIEPRAFLRLSGGDILLPGSEVSASSAEVVVSLIGAYDPVEYPRVGIDLLNENGDIVASVEANGDDGQALMRRTVSGDDGSALYVRIRLHEKGDDEGERLWLSPWFF